MHYFLCEDSYVFILYFQDETVRCPMSGKRLQLKDLIPVNFTLIKDGDNRSLITKDVSTVYMLLS